MCMDMGLLYPVGMYPLPSWDAAEDQAWAAIDWELA